jgi:uncharacterized protein (DUF2267 family)
MEKEQKKIHWFEKLESDIADTEAGEPGITEEQWQLLRKEVGFENHIVESYRWIHETALALGDGYVPSDAYHALRGVFYSLRDRMPTPEVFQFAAQMPVHIRGFFFEGYRIANKPNKFNAEDFLQKIDEEMKPKQAYEPEHVFGAVMQVLYNHISEGELQDIYATMPQDIKTLWDKVRT